MAFLEYIGHVHPLLVHLPIGILLFAFVLMVYGRMARVEVGPAVSLAWLLGAVSAVLACGAGWLLAQSGDYDTDLVQRHQWTGLTTAILSLLTYWLHRYRWVLATATVLVLSVAGHYGGTLTHGEDYLSFKSGNGNKETIQNSGFKNAEPAIVQTAATPGKPAPLVRRTFLYRDGVVPVLETNCYGCHSARKKKGGLRLDSEAFIRQGGKNGRVLLAGNPSQSKLFSYLLLPHDDERHMPPKGKRALTPAQISLIHHWIKKGASFVEEVEILPATTDPLAASTPLPIPVLPLQPLPDTLTREPDNPKPETGAEAGLLAKSVETPGPMVLDKLRQQKITLTKLSEGNGYLTANFVNVNAMQASLLTQLAAIRPQLVRLRLTNQPITDTDTKLLATFPNLTRLNLENTRITDQALTYLSELPRLEQLTIYGTAITDAGLAMLATYPSLKVVYLWQTQTTPAGIERLRKANPKLIVETGSLQLIPLDTSKTR